MVFIIANFGCDVWYNVVATGIFRNKGALSENARVIAFGTAEDITARKEFLEEKTKRLEQRLQKTINNQ